MAYNQKLLCVPSASVYLVLESYEYDEVNVRSFYWATKLCDDLIILSCNKSQESYSAIFVFDEKIRLFYDI
jgi:hypothetical protein